MSGLISPLTGRAFDAVTTMAYFQNQLEKLDPKLYTPLYDVTWQRDIDLLEGVTFDLEATSFIRSKVASVGSQSAATLGSMIPWYSPDSRIPGVAIDGQKVVTLLRLCAQKVSYSSIELDRSQRLNQPIDKQKFAALNILYQMSVDQMVNVGDSGISTYGLCNNTNVAYDLVANGASPVATYWSGKTSAEILNDLNQMLNSAYAASGYAMVPNTIRLDPANFALIVSKPVSELSQTSVLKYFLDNNLCLAKHGVAPSVAPLKWLTGAGQSGKNRMIAYTKAEEFIRFPLAPIRGDVAYYEEINFHRPYLWLMGEVEIVKPETVIYRDGI